MTRNEILRRWPNATEGFIRLNGGVEITPESSLGEFGDLSGVTPPQPPLARPAPNLSVCESTDESKLNKTERAYLVILRARHMSVRIQAITLKLANDCRYTPDFSGIVEGRFTFWEVKGGFMREDGWIKLKLAARLYPEFSFVLAQYKAKTWNEKPVNP